MIDIKDEKKQLSRHHDVIRQLRIRCSGLGYIPPYVTAIAKEEGIPLERLLDGICGKHPEIDDKDNGYIPDLLDAEFDNSGFATFYLCEGTPTGPYPKVRQVDGLTRVHYNTADWAVMLDECGQIKGKKEGVVYPKVCDAWHNSNPRGRKNYLDWIQSFNLNNDPTVVADVVMIDGEGDYSPSNCIVHFSKYKPIIDNFNYPKAEVGYISTTNAKSSCRKSKLSEGFKECLKWARKKCMFGSPPDALINLSEHPEFRSSDVQFLKGKFEEIDDYDIPDYF